MKECELGSAFFCVMYCLNVFDRMFLYNPWSNETYLNLEKNDTGATEYILYQIYQLH